LHNWQAEIEQCGVMPGLGNTGLGWKIFQNPYELGVFVSRMMELDVQTVLEIGSGYGGLSRFMTERLNWQVTSIDLKPPEYQTFGVIQLIGDSRTIPLPSSRYDLVFIDGNHNYAIATSDYRRFAPLADAVVAFHDISGNWHCEGVRQLWRELAYQYNQLQPGYCEVIDPDTARAAGIGWIEV
jgi:SAM-dependent methyltransferase